MMLGIIMKLPRRQFLHRAIAAAVLPAVSCPARAQTYPLRPVRIIVGFPASGTVDILARILGKWLTEHLGQQVTIEDRPGAGSNIAAETVVRSPPDGYTLLMLTSANAINATLYAGLGFDFLRDIALVAGFIRVPLVMVVNPSFSAKTVPKFIAYAKDNPGTISMASAGIGTPEHLAGELFKMMTGVSMIHVPYRGDPPALSDLLGGQVQVTFSSLPPAIEYIRAGELRALAVTTATRSEALPETPTLGEFLPGFEGSASIGVGAPKNTPPEIIDILNIQVNAALMDPKIKLHLADFGGIVIAGSPADFGRLLAEETEKWAKVIRAANIKVE
jgi:tripartite-type tricarboxylate transporter receptor subunit TctC